MSRYDDPQGPGIGATLKDARRRLGIDIKEAEERTKIRTKYLRALEAEDWEVLPAPAYVRGFLRTYGQILGLDGEVLADRYRRSYEEPVQVASAAGEPVLRTRPPGSRPSSSSGWILIVGGVIVVLLIILAVIGLIGGDDGGGGREGGAKVDKQQKSGNKAGSGKNKEPKSGGREPVDLEVEPLSTVRLCLVGDNKNALIDSQVLAEGAAESFSGEKVYRLDLDGGGTVKLRVGEDKRKIDATGDASFKATSKGIEEISYAGPNCP
jgi:Helix-turn-helix domain